MDGPTFILVVIWGLFVMIIIFNNNDKGYGSVRSEVDSKPYRICQCQYYSCKVEKFNGQLRLYGRNNYGGCILLDCNSHKIITFNPS